MSLPSRVVSVWPCNHGDVEVEHVAVPLGVACAECGSYPEHFVPKVALDEAVELLKRWQYNDTTGPGPVEETGEFLERAHYAPERSA